MSDLAPMLGDILNAERSLRAQAEESARELGRALSDLAYRLDGQRLEAQRAADPLAPANWDAARWRAYFATLLPDKPAATWGAALALPEQRAQAETAQLRAEVDRLRSELAEAQREIERLKQAAIESVAPVNKPEEKLAAATPEAAANEIVWPARWPRLPARWAGKLADAKLPTPDDPNRMERLLALLWLVAGGLSIRMEVGDALAARLGLKGRSGSLNRLMEAAVKGGLLGQTVLRVSLAGGSTNLAVLVLTPLGRELSSALGWDLRETEWERLVRLHQGAEQPGHSCAVLAFAYHARRRGYAVEVLPTVPPPVEPDMRVTKAGEDLLVEVELGQDKDNKWRNLAERQGRVALCAASAERRQALVAECRRLRLPGLASDLETLIKTARAEGGPGPLWLETW